MARTITSHRSRGRRSASRAAVCLLAAVVMPIVLHAQLNILTNRYDPQRTGANLTETTLTAANVNVGSFGKLYSYPVDGAVYAQPLYVSGVTIGGTLHNVLYVATMNDKLYAFDADSPSPSPLWVADFTNPPAITPVPITDIASPNLNIVGNVGIHGTPVIDRDCGNDLLRRAHERGAAHTCSGFTLWISRRDRNVPEARLRLGRRSRETRRIRRSDRPAVLISFDPKMQGQRAALALVNGVVLVAWAPTKICRRTTVG